MDKETKGTWGGKREGAGRKAKNASNVTVCWRISEEARDWIAEQSEQAGVSKGEIIDILIKSFEALAKSE